MLDDNRLLLVDTATIWPEDDFGEVDRFCELELDRDEVEDDEATGLLVILLLLIFVELLLVFEEVLLVFVELLLLFAELLVVFVEPLLLLLDVLVLFLLAMTLVSDALNELDVVAVTSLVTFLQIVNFLLHFSVSKNSTYLVEVTVLDTVVVTTCFEVMEGFKVLVTVLVDILRRDWQ